ncbi:hypothetical protein CC86DRAFT_461030 [Ophiobolus disseminans]|uniref:Uncharacterized protein n=1 Tax=Ophiobolus disseminans TaxID=1469910 RepID=A0A6A6ZBS4_9PLEO|nr:hypothetical protein CC86DRAFT_461030 [Ophiobolus disseminans]
MSSSPPRARRYEFSFNININITIPAINLRWPLHASDEDMPKDRQDPLAPTPEDSQDQSTQPLENSQDQSTQPPEDSQEQSTPMDYGGDDEGEQEVSPSVMSYVPTLDEYELARGIAAEHLARETRSRTPILWQYVDQAFASALGKNLAWRIVDRERIYQGSEAYFRALAPALLHELEDAQEEDRWATDGSDYDEGEDDSDDNDVAAVAQDLLNCLFETNVPDHDPMTLAANSGVETQSQRDSSLSQRQPDTDQQASEDRLEPPSPTLSWRERVAVRAEEARHELVDDRAYWEGHRTRQQYDGTSERLLQGEWLGRMREAFDLPTLEAEEE